MDDGDWSFDQSDKLGIHLSLSHSNPLLLLVKTLTNAARMHRTVMEMLPVTTTWGLMVALVIEDILEEEDRVPVRSF